MSQLAKAVVATDTGERKVIPKSLSPLFNDVFSSKAVLQDTVGPDGIAKVFSIGVKIGCTSVVSELEAFREQGALHHAVERTKRQIIEGVFGEFRPYFRRIEKAIYDHDTEEAGRLLHEMEHVMFEAE